MDILKELNERGLAKAILGMVESTVTVNAAEEGELLASISASEANEFKELMKEQEEFNVLTKELRELQAKVNAKGLIIRGKSSIWWSEVTNKYPLVGQATARTGAHVDIDNVCIREGIYKGNPLHTK